jgi:hypothetical protein
MPLLILESILVNISYLLKWFQNYERYQHDIWNSWLSWQCTVARQWSLS